MNHFIELPTGEIINVAHVRKVYRKDTSWVDIDETGNTVYPRELQTCIDLGQGETWISDNDGEVYAYFQSIVQPIVNTE